MGAYACCEHDDCDFKYPKRTMNYEYPCIVCTENPTCMAIQNYYTPTKKESKV